MIARSRGQRLHHWLLALIVIAALLVAVFMTRWSLDLETTVRFYTLHKSLGLLAFVLVMVLLRWRPVMGRGDGEGNWRARLALMVHRALVALVTALPVVGWLQVSAAPVPFPTLLFGLVDVPHFAPLAGLASDARLGWYSWLSGVHRWLGYALGGLIVAHVAGALVPERDGGRPLRRMLGR